MDFEATQSKMDIMILFKILRIKKDILVGTQMLTKGLDFANVEIVGIL